MGFQAFQMGYGLEKIDDLRQKHFQFSGLNYCWFYQSSLRKGFEVSTLDLRKAVFNDLW